MLPLVRRINAKGSKMTRAAVQKALEIEPAVFTNWLSRGAPAARLPDIAAVCGVSTDAYRLEAGMAVKNRPSQGSLETVALLANFEKLPSGLQSHIAQKTEMLLAMYEALPSFLQSGLKKRPSPDSYGEWEKGIEELIAKYEVGKK